MDTQIGTTHNMVFQLQSIDIISTRENIAGGMSLALPLALCYQIDILKSQPFDC
jgi:hypothetical protein